jgi:hypothetical protein
MLRLFFAYSHKDEQLRNEVETHLALLKRQGVISSWHDRRITAGTDLDRAIGIELEDAGIILLLVSASFLASDYCYDEEMKRALAKHDEGTAVVIPVILHPCDWQSSPFGRLRATPTDGKPVSMYTNINEGLAIVAKDIRATAEKLRSSEGQQAIREEPPNPTGSEPRGDRSSNLRIKRKFDDHERDEFLQTSYEYIARYFEGSLDELAKRHPQIKTRFARVSSSRFTASIYDRGERVAQCSVWYGEHSFTSMGIGYSASADMRGSSFNELLSVVDDGFSLQLKSSGMQSMGGGSENRLSQQGAAEVFWSLLIRPLQQ